MTQNCKDVFRESATPKGIKDLMRQEAYENQEKTKVLTEKWPVSADFLSTLRAFTYENFVSNTPLLCSQSDLPPTISRNDAGCSYVSNKCFFDFFNVGEGDKGSCENQHLKTGVGGYESEGNQNSDVFGNIEVMHPVLCFSDELKAYLCNKGLYEALSQSLLVIMNSCSHDYVHNITYGYYPINSDREWDSSKLQAKERFGAGYPRNSIEENLVLNLHLEVFEKLRENGDSVFMTHFKEALTQCASILEQLDNSDPFRDSIYQFIILEVSKLIDTQTLWTTEMKEWPEMLHKAPLQKKAIFCIGDKIMTTFDVMTSQFERGESVLRQARGDLAEEVIGLLVEFAKNWAATIESPHSTNGSPVSVL